MPYRPPTVVAALAESLRSNPGRPLVTYYDGATGERIELSVKTFDNWVSKIANLFTDELMVEPGALVRVDLPVHWQSTVSLVAAWTAGLAVAAGSAGDPEIHVVGPTSITEPKPLTGQVIACSLRPLGGPFASPLPPGWLDFAVEVPPQPDALLEVLEVGPEDTALESAQGPMRHEWLVDQGLAAAAELGLHQGGRLITDANPSRPDGLVLSLVAPLVTGASVVLVANADPDSKASFARQERATTEHWVSPEGAWSTTG